ncbi:MAG: YggS family pyridoxal phosphate-dependent enzyme [Opitutae bacterium]|nr:YggS family pyridoxal phosphate-dependent enzyme [Opitutae bacterium]
MFCEIVRTKKFRSILLVSSPRRKRRIVFEKMRAPDTLCHNRTAMVSYEEFCRNCDSVEARVAAACEKSGRPRGSVKILPVTKNHSVAAPIFAARRGFVAVGENRVKEAAEKRAEFVATSPAELGIVAGLSWELIGHLQSNKARKAVETFSRIQSVDSATLAEKLAKICDEIRRDKLPILLQANPGCDPAKFGTADFDSLRIVVETALSQPRLRVDGLMCVAPIDDDSLQTAARSFETLREWRDKLETEFGQKFPELSMGMSHDMEAAIAAGSTMVRIGTALFGERNYAA